LASILQGLRKQLMGTENSSLARDSSIYGRSLSGPQTQPVRKGLGKKTLPGSVLSAGMPPSVLMGERTSLQPASVQGHEVNIQ